MTATVMERWNPRARPLGPYMGTSMSGTDFRQQIFLSILVRPPAENILSSRPGSSHDRRAQRLSWMAVASTRPMRKCVSRPLLDGPEHGGTLGRVGIHRRVRAVRPAASRDRGPRRNLYNAHNTTRGMSLRDAKETFGWTSARTNCRVEQTWCDEGCDRRRQKSPTPVRCSSGLVLWHIADIGSISDGRTQSVLSVLRLWVSPIGNRGSGHKHHLES